MSQLALFAPEPIRPPPQRRWLEVVAHYVELLQSSETLDALIRQAAAQVAQHRTIGREYGTHFENALAPLLTNPAALEAISEEWVTAGVAAGHGHFHRVVVSSVEGETPPADLSLELRFTNRKPIVLPVNVKTSRPGATSTDACLAMPALLRFVFDADFDILQHRASSGFDPDRYLLGAIASGRLFVPDRDYFLLVTEADPVGAVTGWYFRGLLSTTTADGRPSITRSGRGGVSVRMGPHRKITRQDDVTTALKRELLPPGSAAAIRLQALAAVSKSSGEEELQQAAARLLELSDDEVLRRLVQSL